MKKYIITEEQYRILSEVITHSDGKLVINGNKYDVSVDVFGDVDIDSVTQMSDGSYTIEASKGLLSRTVSLSKQRADEILRQVPSSKILSKGKTNFTLTKTS